MVHCTQVPALHTPLPTMFEQSASLVHAVHAPSLHADAVALVQSLCWRHATHFSAVVSQRGFEPSVQSVFAVHSTHVFEAVSHAGFGAVHVDLSTHSTQVFVAESQAAFGLLHVDLSVHSTQVFVEATHTGVVPPQAPSQGGAPALPGSPFIADEPPPASSPAPALPPAPLDDPPVVTPAVPPLPLEHELSASDVAASTNAVRTAPK